MTLPRPIPGLVISYAYLWMQEALGGAEEGRKDRPIEAGRFERFRRTE